MIKVELFYKVSMYDSDWMMTEAEYDEFRKSANNLPVFFTGPKIKEEEYEKEITKLWNKIDEKDETIEMLTKKPDEQEEEPVISKSMGAGLDKEIIEFANSSRSFITHQVGPDAPEIVCENGACTLILEEEEPEVEFKEKKKPGRKTNRDFSKYIGMFVDGYTKNQIIQDMVADWGITEGSAGSYYFSKVKPEGELKQAEAKDRANEKEKKKFADHLEKKIQVIPTFPYHESKERVHFTEEEKERIRNQASQKW